MTKKGSKENIPVAEIEEQPTEIKDLTLHEQAQHLGGLQFTLAEVSKILGQPLDKDLILAYDRGALLEEAKVREAVKRLAVRGSSPAQKQYNDLTVKTKADNVQYIQREERKRMKRKASK